MTTATFLLSKDPVAEHGGDVELSRLVMRLAADSHAVSVICLSHQRPGRVSTDLVEGGAELQRVAKSGVRPLALLTDTVRTGRSLAHARFDNDDLVAAISASPADVFVAEHSYMAESFLRSTQFGGARFVVNTHVSESLVWRASRGLLGRLQAGRLVRDELRVARAAGGLAAYGVEPTWFGLGDRDVATHLVRTQMLDAGYALSEVTEALCARWQPGVRLLPMSDDRVETHVAIADADTPIWHDAGAALARLSVTISLH